MPMNAAELEQAISDLALQPFDAAVFPFAFLAALGKFILATDGQTRHDARGEDEA